MRRNTSKTAERDLLAQLAASPGDLALRQVYADVLTQRGLPRGEFITLQLLALTRKLDRAQRTRVQALERAHAFEWLGPLVELVESHAFEGGFLSRASLRHAPATAWQDIGAQAVAHELASLRQLALDPRTPPEHAALLLGGRLPLLETVVIGPELADVVRCKLGQLAVDIVSEVDELPPIRIAFDPAPTELMFTVVDYDWLAAYAATLFAQVYRDGLPRETERFVVRSYNQLVLSRDDRGTLSRLAARCGPYGRPTLVQTVATVIDACPDRAFTTVDIDVELTPSERRRLRRALVRCPGAELTSTPHAAAGSRGRRAAGSRSS